jgi:putative two-component system response regulator
MAEETVLVVEDNDMLREGLDEILSSEGFSVVCASNGQEALELMKTISPDIIVSDVAMPVIDGYEFFHAVRERQEWVTIPFIFLTARSEPDDLLTGRDLGVDDYLTKPISRQELVTTIHSRLERSRQIQVARFQQAYMLSLTALANAIEDRNPNSQGHVKRITDMALTLAEYLGWHNRMVESLRFGAILHDIGKIHIPEDILFKKTVLTKEEWEIIKAHPSMGAEMITGLPFLADAVPIVRHHHERWDGQGYPEGLSGESIPEGARILAVVDAFDNMTTSSTYSPLKSPQEAYEEILELSGRNYDPKIVSAFKLAWEEDKILSSTQKVTQNT